MSGTFYTPTDEEKSPLSIQNMTTPKRNSFDRPLDDSFMPKQLTLSSGRKISATVSLCFKFKKHLIFSNWLNFNKNRLWKIENILVLFMSPETKIKFWYFIREERSE